jgi:hypothetical protein
MTISIILGIKIIFKYFKFKRKEFILFGLVAVLVTEPWWPSTFLFLSILIFSIPIDQRLCFLLGNIFIPLTLLLWLAVFTDLIKYKRKKMVLIIFSIEGILFEVVFLYALFTNPSLIGTIDRNLDINYGIYISLYHLSVLIITIITVTLFTKVTLKSDNPEVRLQGKLILIAVYSFIIGATLDILSANSLILLISARMILILASIILYGGFILPDWMKKIILKQEK